jgi:acetolactate synthase-1/2/3 large subunit
LEDEGIPFTFGIPGTHNIELYDALAESRSVRPILVTDEQSASFMADAVWRSSGRLGCVSVVPGAGLTPALSGIAEAYMDNVGMLVLGCGVRRDTGHAYQLHDIDQLAVVAPVTKAQLRPERGEELYTTVREACRFARAGAPGPVMVEVPANLYLVSHDRGQGRDERFDPSEAPAPPPPVVEQAAEILNGAKRPLLYLGLGAAPAGAALVRLAEALEAPVATTFQGKGVFPEAHPLSLWPGFGDAAPGFARRVARGCDATLAIGCRFGEVATGSYGLTPPSPLIHVDIDPAVLNRNYTAAVDATADSAVFVDALLPKLEAKPTDEALREAIRTGHTRVRAAWREAAARGADTAGADNAGADTAGLEAAGTDAEGADVANGSGRGVSPFLLLEALQESFGPDTIFTADSGNGTFLAVECLRLDAPGHLLAPVDYSCMGYAVPAAIGAGLARPDAPTVALAGDGAFLMTGLELLTAADRGVPVLVVILRDQELAQIAQFQEVVFNRTVASRLPDYDPQAICTGVGVECLSMRTDGEIASTLKTAAEILGRGEPCVIDVTIDYSEKTFFTKGVVKTNFLRLPWRERLRMVGRAIGRRVRG